MAQKGKTKVVLYKDSWPPQFDTVNCVKNVFKINPLLFFRGEIPLYYERALTAAPELGSGCWGYLSGITWRYSFAGDDADDYGAGAEIISKSQFPHRVYATIPSDRHRTARVLYCRLEFAHLQYTKDIRQKSPTGAFTDKKLRDERIYNDLRLLFGYQLLAAQQQLDVRYLWRSRTAYRDRAMVKVEKRWT